MHQYAEKRLQEQKEMRELVEQVVEGHKNAKQAKLKLQKYKQQIGIYILPEKNKERNKRKRKIERKKKKMMPNIPRLFYFREVITMFTERKGKLRQILRIYIPRNVSM